MWEMFRGERCVSLDARRTMLRAVGLVETVHITLAGPYEASRS